MVLQRQFGKEAGEIFENYKGLTTVLVDWQFIRRRDWGKGMDQTGRKYFSFEVGREVQTF